MARAKKAVDADSEETETASKATKTKATISTGNRILDAQLAALQKTIKREHVFSFGPGFEQADPLPTGSMALDVAIGIGGIPMGRIVELYGPEASGKTSLALRILKSWLDNREALGQGKRKALFVDAEHVTGMDMLLKFGIDPKEVVWLTPKTTEEALNTVDALVKTGQIGIMILDSVDALQNESQLKKQIGEDTMGGIAKYLATHLRTVSKTALETNTLMLYINQVKYNMDPYGGGGKWISPGGKALKFYASLRMQTMTQASSTVPGAFKMRVKIIKNKVAPPRGDSIDFDFLYAQGPEPFLDLIAAAKDAGVLRYAGSSCRVKFHDADEEEAVCSGGAAGLRLMLIEEPKTYLRLRQSVLEAGGTHVEPTGTDTIIDEGDYESESESESESDS